MSLLLEAPARVSAPRTPAPGRRWLLPVSALVLALIGAGATAVLAAPRAASFEPIAPRVTGAPYVTVPEYGAHGAYILGYEHEAQVQLTLPVVNSGRLPVTITSVELGEGPAPLVAVAGVRGLPLRLGPGQSGQVAVSAVLTNCRYFHERAMQTYAGVTIGFTSLGREGARVVAFDRPMLVKAPMLVGCPGRKLDRSAVNRTDLL